MDLSTLPPLRDVINDNGLRAEKAFGQNFLLDLNLTKKIAKQAGDLSGKHVIEIGPGPGGLTRALIESDAKSVTAIEFDERCVKALQPLQDMSGSRFNLIHGDGLKTDLTEIVPNGPRVIIANLPYNVATPLLTGWLKQLWQDNTCYDGFALMFQKEVAERIVAQKGDKAYGRLAILSQWLCDCRISMTLPPSAFTPPPKINSAIVSFKPKKLPRDIPFELLETVTAKAFGQRRKMVRQSLKDYSDHFETVGINPTDRAENIDIETYVSLVSSISNGTP
jgi:16S rRNA (adenine1518-N6/adenine1519-N6)-dimethyltransferase